MVKGIDDAGLASVSCFLHKLQLVIKDSIRSRKAVSDVMTRARNIATRFNHSASACSLLESIQKDLGLPCHKMVQDVPTRWNSSYLMLERLYEQRRAISAIAPDIGLTILSNNEWNILGSMVSLLKPFEELTKRISSDRCTIADVLPAVAMLRRYLEKDDPFHSGVKALKSELLRSLNTRFSATEKDDNFTFATINCPLIVSVSLF